jgi:uncharacterized membrane protein YphA (DoxX/SURF4 family)
MATIARCLIAFFFVASGSGKIFAFRQSSTILASIGFPIPTFFLTAIIAVEIAGGLGLLFNLWTSYILSKNAGFAALDLSRREFRMVRGREM